MPTKNTKLNTREKPQKKKQIKLKDRQQKNNNAVNALDEDEDLI